MTDAGGRVAFAEKALVLEPVPEKRARFGWLMKRRFRSGQTHGRIIGAKKSAAGRLSQTALAGAKAGFCLLGAAAYFLSPIQRNRYALRSVLHLGAISGIMGMREIRQYGSVEAA